MRPLLLSPLPAPFPQTPNRAKKNTNSLQKGAMDSILGDLAVDPEMADITPRAVQKQEKKSKDKKSKDKSEKKDKEDKKEKKRKHNDDGDVEVEKEKKKSKKSKKEKA